MSRLLHPGQRSLISRAEQRPGLLVAGGALGMEGEGTGRAVLAGQGGGWALLVPVSHRAPLLLSCSRLVSDRKAALSVLGHCAGHRAVAQGHLWYLPVPPPSELCAHCLLSFLFSVSLLLQESKHRGVKEGPSKELQAGRHQWCPWCPARGHSRNPGPQRCSL